MTPPPITIRRHIVVYGRHRKPGWRWTCALCPPTRGRTRAGFHRNNRLTDARNPRRYPGAWERCKNAALLHLHTHHGAAAPTRPMSTYRTVTQGVVDMVDVVDMAGMENAKSVHQCPPRQT